MHSLAQPKVLRSAGVAALLASAACYPRLALWPEAAGAVSYLWFILLWTMFVLWGFVFAWHFQYSHRDAISFNFQPKIWAAATLCGVAFALAAHFWVDPRLRLITPRDYPASLSAWVATSLFTLAFEPLFLCFAPFAFFIRLFRRHERAVALTVGWGLFVLAMRLESSHKLPPIWLVAELLAARVLAGFAWVYFYLKGGALVVWWMVLLLQLRYLTDIFGAQ